MPAATAQQPLPMASLALAFGYSEPVGQAASQAELVLKACFVSSLGHARALIASREGESLYRVGDRIPGGSVLRRIEVGSITLWDGEREQGLALSGSRANVFVQSGSTHARGSASADSPRLLREVQ
ncbi:type II secretion system protein N [Pseudomonas sp. NPDC090592]|uniref:type II secretion system protein N n=1 Tax=Pseudomonas sp. NPDC090592 TaxID=3364480 RepID=UPI00383B23B0